MAEMALAKKTRTKIPRPHEDVHVLGAMVRAGDETVAKWIVQTLIEHQGNVPAAAKGIGMTARGLYKWVSEPRAHASLREAFRKHATGHNSFPQKIPDKKIALVFKMRNEEKLPLREIAKKFKVDVSTISLILNGKRREDVAAE